MAFYILYKTINLVNNKFYIGFHRTEDYRTFDGYYGSGLLLKRAIKKYGKENFKRVVLAVYSEDDYDIIRCLEKKYLTENKLKSNQCYNVSIGGQGGYVLFGFDKLTDDMKEERLQKFRERNRKISEKKRERLKDPEYHKRLISNMKKIRKTPNNKGKRYYQNSEGKVIFVHPDNVPEGFFPGTPKHYHSKPGIWITNGKDNKKIGIDDPIPEGWTRGRTIKEENKFKGHKKEVVERMAKERKGKIWITNGTETRLISKTDKIPEGWRRGLSSKNRKKFVWITNGSEDKHLPVGEKIPEGWVRGRSANRKSGKTGDKK